ncbi:MAG: protease modulator HflC [Gammaproteobacteria bacterium]|nr:protease modulator HflC [Gammaproteobacteria bacterium]MCH9744706.1 protease modulator HflC [Gammaproteobacteria bacterium]
MNTKLITGIIIGIIALFIWSLSAFTVVQGSNALILRLGKMQVDAAGNALVVGPGLHFKTPFVTTVRDFDTRLQTLNGESSRIITENQKSLVVSYYAKWRITDLPLYYKRTRGMAIRTENLLTQQINDAIRAAFGKRSIQDVVSGERMNVMQLLRDQANKSAKEYGVSVTDVRIVQIELPPSVQDYVYQRMRTAREKVATQHRSQGKAVAESTRAEADAEVEVMLATAKANAQAVRAAGDATAANVYTKAYNKDPSFYALYRSLQAYRQVFINNKETVMVLKPNSQFFKYFSQPVKK